MKYRAHKNINCNLNRDSKVRPFIIVEDEVVSINAIHNGIAYATSPFGEITFNDQYIGNQIQLIPENL